MIHGMFTLICGFCISQNRNRSIKITKQEAEKRPYWYWIHLSNHEYKKQRKRIRDEYFGRMLCWAVVISAELPYYCLLNSRLMLERVAAQLLLVLLFSPPQRDKSMWSVYVKRHISILHTSMIHVRPIAQLFI